MSIKIYDHYKESGIAWLGKVPATWKVAAIKHGFDIKLGKMLQPDSKGEGDILAPYIRAANIQWKGVDTSDIKLMWFSPQERAELALQENDLLISEGGDVGRACLWRNELEECYFQNSVNRARSKSGNSPGFGRYWLSTLKDKGFIDVLCNKSTIAHYTAEKLAATPALLPPHSEQVAIAAFLDRETAKIDALIAEQQRLIELLQEKRQVVISHAVTKGLNPNAPMKESGVEWLGEVPEHWETGKIKHYFRTTSGSTPNSDKPELYYTTEEDEQGTPWIRTTDIDDGEVKAAAVFITPKALGDTACKPLPVNTVLVALYGGGGTVGKNGILKIEAAVNQALCAILPSPKALPEYVHRYIQFLRPFWMERAVSARKAGNISQELVGDTIFPMPPLEEQAAILSSLEEKLEELDELSGQSSVSLGLLEERRAALISAAVTGQIDVRGLATEEAA